MKNTLEDRIRERAYAIWSAHGRIDGEADQHWLAAEREVLATLTAQIPAPIAGTTRKPRSRTTPTAAKPAARAARR